MRDRLIELIQLAKTVEQVAPTYDDIGRNMIFANFLINNGVTVQEWISVEDRLPDADDWVLVCKKTIETGFTSMAVDKCTLTIGGNRMWLVEQATWKRVITHWMPLPQPPKGE